MRQTHSKNICTPLSLGSNTEGEDGIIFSIFDIDTAVIKTADCLPICLIGDNDIGLIHAGWRGMRSKIHLDMDIKKINPHTIVIGPSICSSCFEVSPEFKEYFPQHEEYFYQDDDKLFFKIKDLALNQLSDHYPESNIIDSGQCTLCTDYWHSFRRNKTTKRNYTIFQKR